MAYRDWPAGKTCRRVASADGNFVVRLTHKALSALLSGTLVGESVVKVTTASVAERDQERGKSKLNGTALDPWAFNPRFSSTADMLNRSRCGPEQLITENAGGSNGTGRTL